MAAKKQRLVSDECATTSHTLTPASRKTSNRVSQMLDDIEIDDNEASILQNNIYTPLANKETEILSRTKIPLNKNSPPPPPITINNTELVKIKELLKSFEHYSDTNIKATKDGIKLFVKSTDQYKKLKAFLCYQTIQIFLSPTEGRAKN